MSFTDIPETESVISGARRVTKLGHFLQFSITHPCLDAPHRRSLRDDGMPCAYEVGDHGPEPGGSMEHTCTAGAIPPSSLDVRVGELGKPEQRSIEELDLQDAVVAVAVQGLDGDSVEGSAVVLDNLHWNSR